MSNMGIRIGHRVLQEISCNTCVKTSGCVYCPDQYSYQTYEYGGSGLCQCENNFDFGTFNYGPPTCGSYQEEFNSPLDCQFGSENGEGITAAICIVVVIVIGMICCSIAKSGACSEEGCLSSSPPVASKPPRPAYTPEERAPPPVAVAIDDPPESLRMCSVLATDVVLVSSAPVEEPITVISAESEIIVSPSYDV